ncbi:hypothetical protein [Mangrovimonas futianensis]|uniref:hypothetical protein n=1 Tax=Mangrovimonas futianensis TaxID=2895523 RepID=UPI001E374E45|nr:hypothetical protein [Mangrovimonas futianensis]MCF1421674.1 hypothetical protein [Mangrovimonas futianensis]
MKKLVFTFILTVTTTAFYAQEDVKKESKDLSNDTTEIVVTPVKNTVALKNSTKKRLLIESNFDKSLFLFRGRKSKREKLC